MTPVSIKVNNLQWRLGEGPALRGVDLSVQAGEFCALLGPKGSGKTALLRVLYGLEKPDFGRVLQNETDVTALPPARRDMGAVFGDAPLHPGRSVLYSVMQGLKRGDRKARAREMLALCGLSQAENKRPGDLTGYEYALAALARVLAARPQALLLDDPFLGLVPPERRKLLAFLKALQKEWGFCVIYATQDAQEAMAAAHRLALMAAGRVEQSGTPEELYDHPQSAAAALALGPANLLPCTVAARGHGGRLSLFLEGLTLPARAYDPPPSIGEDVLLCLRPEHIRLSARPSPKSHVSGLMAGRRTQGGRPYALVSLPTGAPLLCPEPEGPAIPAGSLVFLHWDVEKAPVIPGEEGFSAV